jgi:hypothetical protein
MAEHAVAVAVATATACLFAVLWLEPAIGGSRKERCFVTMASIVAGTVVAAASYWILKLMSDFAASANSLSQYPGSAIGLTVMVAAGWLVGLIVGASQWLPFTRKRSRRDGT